MADVDRRIRKGLEKEGKPIKGEERKTLHQVTKAHRICIHVKLHVNIYLYIKYIYI
jgi:hypothetical protein